MGIDYRLLVILAGVGVVILAWLLLRFGRTIAKAALVLAALVVVVIVALALSPQGVANYQTARATTEAVQAVKVASIGNTLALVVGALCVGALGTLTVGALAVAAVLVHRQRLETQRRRTLPRRRRTLPDPTAQPVVWVVDMQDRQGVNLGDVVDLSEWGW